MLAVVCWLCRTASSIVDVREREAAVVVVVVVVVWDVIFFFFLFFFFFFFFLFFIVVVVIVAIFFVTCKSWFVRFDDRVVRDLALRTVLPQIHRVKKERVSE